MYPLGTDELTVMSIDINPSYFERMISSHACKFDVCCVDCCVLITWCHLSLPNTIFSVLSRADPDKVMLVDGEVSISYREAIDRVESLSEWLGMQGVGPGDRVVIQLRKCVNEIFILYAVARLGAVFVNVHPLWSDTQLRHVVESSGAKLAFVEENRTHALLGFNSVMVVVGGLTQGGQDALFSRVHKECSGNLPPAMEDPEALATIIYTSGSTGKPKGVMHSHRNLVELGKNVATCLKNTQNDRILSVLPLSFGYGLSQLLTVAYVGATLVLQKSALAADVLDAIQPHSITGLAAVPSIWKQIVEVQKNRTAKYTSLRYFTNAGDAPGGRLIDDIAVCFSWR